MASTASPTSLGPHHQRRATSEPNLREAAQSAAERAIDVPVAGRLDQATVSLPTPTAPATTPTATPAPAVIAAQPGGNDDAARRQQTRRNTGGGANGGVGGSGWRYWWRRTSRFLGFGRGNEARKETVTLIFTLCWGTAQIVTIVLLLVAAALTSSPPFVNEWETRYCDRPLGAWAVVWCIRILVGFFVSIVLYRASRNRATGDAEAGPAAAADGNADTHGLEDVGMADAPHPPAGINPGGNDSAAAEIRRSSLERVANRISTLTSFFSVVWFIVAHVLLYTTIDTCHKSAPHLWWACFAIVCIGYIVVLEVLIVGAVVFILVPLVFFVVNVVLVCLGREPLQMGHAQHEVAKLSQRAVDKIPLVLYIPPPPEGFVDVPPPSHAHGYPPTRTDSQTTAASRRGVFRFLRRKHKQSKDKAKSMSPIADDPEEGGEMWEDKWEKGDHPFVRLDENRAICAICLMDFEAPKKLTPSIVETAAPAAQNSEHPQEPGLITVEDALAAGDADGLLRLEDAGEGVQPLRLLACGHVFHKTCLDPWLINQSGRCPTCQQPVEVNDGSGRKRRRRRRNGDANA